MNKSFKFLLLFLYLGVLAFPVQAWEHCCPHVERYFNYSRADGDGLYYGYEDIYAYPYGYALPVNYYFNYCPCRCKYSDYEHLQRAIRNSGANSQKSCGRCGCKNCPTLRQ